MRSTARTHTSLAERLRASRRRTSDGTFFTRHPLAVSAGCAALAAVFVLAYVTQVNAQATEARAEMLARYGGEQVEVCVATKDISAGQTVDASVVTTRLWVADLLPEGAVRTPSEVIGKTAASPILAGEVVCQARFSQAEVSYDVPFGMTAVCVPAKEVQAVGGAIEPGMRIDIYATGNSATALIGSEVLVLATNRQPGGVNDTSGASSQTIQWITVALDPARVEETVAAAQNLALYFTLPGEGVVPVRVDPVYSEDDALESASAEAPVGNAEATDAAAAAAGKHVEGETGAEQERAR